MLLIGAAVFDVTWILFERFLFVSRFHFWIVSVYLHFSVLVESRSDNCSCMASSSLLEGMLQREALRCVFLITGIHRHALTFCRCCFVAFNRPGTQNLVSSTFSSGRHVVVSTITVESAEAAPCAVCYVF